MAFFNEFAERDFIWMQMRPFRIGCYDKLKKEIRELKYDAY